jgi:site-specific DNA-methyltransferase (adenine-specific)
MNQIFNADCFDILKDLPSNSVDAVITDPPYGINLSHWDKAININELTTQSKRITTDFYVFFGQMPTVSNFINHAQDNFNYLEHVSWVKRTASPCVRLSRSHESIYLYTKNKKKFYSTKGKYEDVKLPGILFDIATIESYQRHISNLQSVLQEKSNGMSNSYAKPQKEYKRIKQKEHIRTPVDVNFTNVWSFLPPTQVVRNGQYLHPTEKPLEVIKRLVEMCSPVGGTILDPFAGSFTLAIACLELGRNYICIEKDKEYFEIGKARIAKWHEDNNQRDLFPCY